LALPMVVVQVLAQAIPSHNANRGAQAIEPWKAKGLN
jgi:hypothetical protein